MAEDRQKLGHAHKGQEGAKEARIQHIEALMREFRWERGKSHRELAKEWGLTEKTVMVYTSEASRRISAAVMDPESVNAAVGKALERALGEAMDRGDLRHVAKLCETWAKISGSGAPEKHEHSVNANPEGAARLVREAFGEAATPRDEARPVPDAEPVPEDATEE